MEESTDGKIDGHLYHFLPPPPPPHLQVEYKKDHKESKNEHLLNKLMVDALPTNINFFILFFVQPVH